MNLLQAIRDAEESWARNIAPLIQGWIAQEQAEARYEQRLLAYLAQPIGPLVPRSPARDDRAEWTPSIKNYRKFLRRLAGLTGQPDPRRPARNEWSGSKQGRAGPLTCRPAQWDNAIRALEEDR